MPFENTGSKGEYLRGNMQPSLRSKKAVEAYLERAAKIAGKAARSAAGGGSKASSAAAAAASEPASTVRGKSETKPSDAKPKARSAAATPLEMPKLRKTDASKYNLKLSKDEPDTQTKVARVVDVGGKCMGNKPLDVNTCRAFADTDAATMRTHAEYVLENSPASSPASATRSKLSARRTPRRNDRRFSRRHVPIGVRSMLVQHRRRFAQLRDVLVRLLSRLLRGDARPASLPRGARVFARRCSDGTATSDASRQTASASDGSEAATDRARPRRLRRRRATQPSSSAPTASTPRTRVFVSPSSCSPSSRSTPRRADGAKSESARESEEAANLRVTEFREKLRAALATPLALKVRSVGVTTQRSLVVARAMDDPLSDVHFLSETYGAAARFSRQKEADALADRVRADASTAAKSLVEDVFGEEEEADQRERRASRGASSASAAARAEAAEAARAPRVSRGE